MHSLEKQPVAPSESEKFSSFGVIALIVLMTWAAVALGLALYFLSASLAHPRVRAPSPAALVSGKDAPGAQAAGPLPSAPVR